MHNLRVVRDASCPGPPGPPGLPGREKLQVDPRVAALLARYTIGTASGGKYIFSKENAEILSDGLRGRWFSDENLVAIEAWLRKNDPYQLNFTYDVHLRMLDMWVDEQLRQVEQPRWLREPLNAFMALFRDEKGRDRKDIKPALLRAAFTAFLTIRA